MNRILRAVVGGSIAVSISSMAFAQAQPLVLRQGTPISLKNRFELNTKGVAAGQRFEVDVSEDVKVGDVVVIPAGTHGVGEVTRAEKNGHFGKSGKLDTRILYIDLNGQHIEMDGQANDKGKSGTVGTVAAIVGFGVLGIFVHGTSAKLEAGAPMTAYVHSDMPVAVAAALVQTAIVVPAPAAPAVVAPAATPAVLAPAPAPAVLTPAPGTPATTAPAKVTSTAYQGR